MFHFPDDSDGDDELEQRLRSEADALHAKYSDLEDELRKVGIYTDDHQMATTGDGAVCMIVIGTIGDVAFKKRVQDPEGDAMDRELRGITATSQINGFLDVRGQMLKDIDGVE